MKAWTVANLSTRNIYNHEMEPYNTASNSFMRKLRNHPYFETIEIELLSRMHCRPAE